MSQPNVQKGQVVQTTQDLPPSPVRKVRSARRRGRVSLALAYVALTLIGVLAVYPALWVIASSFRVGTALYSDRLLPTAFTLDHYRTLFERYPFALWFWNTLKIALCTMVLNTMLVTLTGYVFSRFRFKGRKPLMLGLLVCGLFPGFMSMVAIYILLMQLKLLDTHLSLIIVYSSGAALGFLYVKSFFDTIPSSLLDAARIDGASHWTVFVRIMLPLSKPMLVFVALTSFSGAFVDFIFANMVLTDQNKLTLAVALFKMVKVKFSTEFTIFAAGCVLVAVPIAVLFILLQRYLVEGLTSGAEKS